MTHRRTTLYWHDYETFGRTPRRDRPAQFAGLRTDEELNPIGEPLLLYCQPPPDLLPEPDACLLTGITPQRAQREGVPEPQFIARILQEMATPNTCTLGYNSLRFDDEVTRHTLYRNFYDPYAREWEHGNSRWDLIDLVRVTYALRPDGIQWPLHPDGKPSFRLEDLTAANDIHHSDAHDALADVYATLALARLLRRQQPKLYSYFYQHRDKRSVRALLDLDTLTPVVHSSRMFPASQGCTTLVVPLVDDPRNKNGVVVYDLRVDPEPLLSLDADAIAQRLFTASTALPEGTARIALKTVHVNKCPIVAPATTLRDADAARIDLDKTLCERHRAQLQAHLPSLRHKLSQVFDRPWPSDDEAPDPEQQLYGGGFFSPADRRAMSQLHQRLAGQSTEQAATTLTTLAHSFEDARLPILLFRYRARFYPHSLTATEQQRWRDFRRQRLLAGSDGGLSLDAYQARLAELRAEPERSAAAEVTLLDDLRSYGEQLTADLGAA